MPTRRRDTLPKSHRRTAGVPALSSRQERRLSRRAREARRRRQLYAGLASAAALIVLVLVGFSLNEFWFKPRAVLATVEGHDIRRRDYWKYRAVDLANQANQYISIANSPFVDDNQRQQYVTLAQQANAQIDEVWGSTDLNEATLQNMIDDYIYVSSLDEFGITISEEDVQNYINRQFEPAEAPIFTPTPLPTLIPERAEWATQTAAAFSGPELATPVADGTPAASPVGYSASPMASPVHHAATPAPAVDGTPVDLAATPAASPVSEITPVLTPTPNQEQALQTAEAGFEEYQETILERARMSRSDYVRLIVRPQIARERIDTQLTAGIGQRAEQVRASHILVDTKDLADAIYAELQAGADFAQTAIDQSIDAGTAPNGGDLGWFTRGQMVDEFEQVAFSTPPGQISAPFETEFGWHIVKVVEHDPDRAMTDEQISRLRQAVIDDWMASKKAEMSISSEIQPTPTSSGPRQFVPPPDAPPLPTEPLDPADVIDAGTPESLPIASPPSVATPQS